MSEVERCLCSQIFCRSTSLLRSLYTNCSACSVCMINVDRGKGGGRGSKLWFGKRRFFNIYVFFSLWIIKKKTSKYSKASAVKNLKLSSSMWSYHCKKFGVGESLKKKSYKSEGEEVPSPSLPPPSTSSQNPPAGSATEFLPDTTCISHQVFFLYIYFNRMHPPAPDWARRLSQDVVLSGYHVPTGVSQIVQCFWTRLHSSFY